MSSTEVEKKKLTKEEKAAKKLRKAAKAAKAALKETPSVTPSSSVENLAAAGSKKRSAPDDASSVAKKAKTERPTSAEFYKLHAIEILNVTSELEPMLQFAEAPFNAASQKQLLANYPTPTPTQSVSWPLALRGDNLISVAKTGSGKTLAFLLPTFHRLEAELKAQETAARTTGSQGSFSVPAPRAIVMAPTRELAMQISAEAEKFAPAYGCKCATLYGGAPKWEQVKQLRLLGKKGIVIATPGRLNDMLDIEKLTLTACTTVVLDEADRMLDMGFEPQIRSIVDRLTQKQQILFFTATWSKAVNKVVNSVFKIDGAAKVVFNEADTGKLVANKDITQTVEIVQDMRDKKQRALTLLKSLHTDGEEGPTGKKTIVFVATKRLAAELANELWSMKFKADAIHGDRMQWEREEVIAHFKESKLNILVATDVAARGLDIVDVTNVLNYDFPSGSHGVEDYIHRIGRTGRAGRKGEAVSYLNSADINAHGKQLVAILQDAGQHVSPELLAKVPTWSSKGGSRKGGNRKGGKGYGGRGGGGKGGKGKPSWW